MIILDIISAIDPDICFVYHVGSLFLTYPQLSCASVAHSVSNLDLSGFSLLAPDVCQAETSMTTSLINHPQLPLDFTWHHKPPSPCPTTLNKFPQNNSTDSHYYGLLPWGLTHLQCGDMGQGVVRDVVRSMSETAMTAVSLPSCTIDKGLCDDLYQGRPPADEYNIERVLAWCTSGARELSDGILQKDPLSQVLSG